MSLTSKSQSDSDLFNSEYLSVNGKDKFAAISSVSKQHEDGLERALQTAQRWLHGQQAAGIQGRDAAANEAEQLQLQVNLHTLEHTLRLSRAKCRALERQSPMADLFARYEREVATLQRQLRQEQEEGCTLAARLAESEVARICSSGAGES